MDILIVEDEEVLRESLLDGLRAAFVDATVQAAPDAEAAELILSQTPARLVISDIRLPGKDGVSLLLDVRRTNPNVQFLFMSAFPSEEARTQAQRLGVRFLTKPFELEDLIEAVQTALGDKRFSGALTGVHLIDLLQLLNMGRRTAVVTITTRDRSGEIYIVEGEVAHAVTQGMKGREAFDVMIKWPGGTFGCEPNRVPPETTISEPFNAILIDVFRIQDEADRAEADEAVFEAAGLSGDDLVEVGGLGSAGDERPDLQAMLEPLIRIVPDCVAAAWFDLAGPAELGWSSEAEPPKAVRHLIPEATADLFRSQALQKLDQLIQKEAAGASEASGGPIREVIALTSSYVYVFQRPASCADRVFAIVSRRSPRLGSIIAKARACAQRMGPGYAG